MAQEAARQVVDVSVPIGGKPAARMIESAGQRIVKTRHEDARQEWADAQRFGSHHLCSLMCIALFATDVGHHPTMLHAPFFRQRQAEGAREWARLQRIAPRRSQHLA